jgi:N-acetylglucosaminyldiphosphoundecaprenol N-acetyl-beta-D-mannosaminyltransferase
MGVGGAFDVYAGVVGRAPRWMQRLGLEWLFRLIQEPKRMWRRYLVDDVAFVKLLLRELRRSRSHGGPG